MLRRRFWLFVGVITVSLIALYYGFPRATRATDRLQEAVLDRDELSAYIDNIDALLLDHPKHWPGDKWTAARKITLARLESLRTCLELDNCAPGQKTIVIGGSFHFGGAASGSVSGEDIWARSSIDAFEKLGYTFLYSYRELEALELYRAFPKLVQIVIMDAVLINNCLHFDRPQRVPLREITSGRFRQSSREEWESFGLPEVESGAGEVYWAESMMEGKERHEGCIRRVDYPEGIPIWKTLSWHFWANSAHPLGGRWTLSPEDYAKQPAQKSNPDHNRYLGYSIEQWCQGYRSSRPSSSRPQEAFILSKVVDTFDSPSFPWGGRENRTVFANLASRYGVSFYAGAGSPADEVVSQGVTNVGRMNLVDFNERLAQSRMVIGIGNPLLSPTPYDALCLGTPFINPIAVWDKENPNDRTAWISSFEVNARVLTHGSPTLLFAAGRNSGLLQIDPPYVYHVRHNDLEGLELAVREALRNPIESYIPAHLTAEALRRRHQELIVYDWEAEAAIPLEELRRHKTGLHENVF